MIHAEHTAFGDHLRDIVRIHSLLSIDFNLCRLPHHNPTENEEKQ